MADIDTNVHLAYGFIDDLKLLPGNWSVKVVVYPQPPAYIDAKEPLRYGGWVAKSESNEDGYGEWITPDLAEGELFPKRPDKPDLPANPASFPGLFYFITSWHHCPFLAKTRRFLD